MFKMKDEKKEKFIKVMVSERLYKKIDRYSHLQLQTKSEFIRTAVRRRIAEINRSIYPNKTDPQFNRINRRDVLKELKNLQSTHEKREYLTTPSKEELIERENILEERKKELEKELDKIEKERRIVIMTDKVEFGSKEYLDLAERFLKELTQEAGEQANDADYSMCEVYYNAPPHLALEGDRIAWHFRIKNNKINFGIGEVDDVDIKVMGDYQTLCHISKLEYDPNDLQKIFEIFSEPMQSGKYTFQGDLSKIPKFLNPIHNLLAKRLL